MSAGYSRMTIAPNNLQAFQLAGRGVLTSKGDSSLSTPVTYRTLPPYHFPPTQR